MGRGRIKKTGDRCRVPTATDGRAIYHIVATNASKAWYTLFLNRLDEIHFGKRYNWIYKFSRRSKSHCYGTYLWWSQRSSWLHIIIIIIIIIVTVRSEKDTRNNNYDREHTYLQLQHMYKVKIFIIRDGHTIRRGVFYFGVSQPIPRHDDIWWPPRTRAWSWTT